MFFTDLIKVSVLPCCHSLFGFTYFFQKKFAVYAFSAALICSLTNATQAQVHNGDLRDECRSNFNNFEKVLSRNISKLGIFDEGYDMLNNMMDFIDWCIKNDLLEKRHLKG